MLKKWLHKNSIFLSKLSCFCLGVAIVLPFKIMIIPFLAACFFDYLALKFSEEK